MTELPTHTEIRKARKAELVTWCEQFGLDAEGTVDDLRTRLLEHVDAAEAAEPPEGAPAKVAEDEAVEDDVDEADDEDEEEDEEEPSYKAKQKPKLSPELERLLRARKEISDRRPAFRRQEWFRYQRLGTSWRRPKGHHSKMRRHIGYRPPVVSIGFRGPKAVRGLHPSGFREVRVFRAEDLGGVDPATEAVRIASGVGTRRRTEIVSAADDLGIRVLNRREDE